MKSHIPEHLLEELRTRADIIDVISEYVPLKSTGKNFKGLCPFHQEKTPSFTANREKQIYHCFGCGAGGNVFRFIMAMEDLPFIEAVRRLASRYQVTLPESGSTDRPRDGWNEKEVLYKINGRAAAFYHGHLKAPSGKPAQDYLQNRSISEKTVEQFQIGWAPDEWRNLQPAMQGDDAPSPELLTRAGLLIKKEKEDSREVTYDRFRGRVMFPIADLQGRIIGFGGRIIGEGEPKYLNSPETAVYKKGQFLYGLHLAKEAIRKRDQVLIVEGYFDVIRCFEGKIENAVATCGTALTLQQALALKPYTRNVVLLFDADEAGHTAARRGYEVLVEQGLNVQVAALPKGHDPDTLVAQEGPEALTRLIDAAPPFLQYYLDRLVALKNPATPEGKREIANEILPLLARIPNTVERSEWVRLISEQLGVEDRAILGEMKKALGQNRLRLEPQAEAQRAAAAFDPEYYLVHLMLNGESVAREIREVLAADEFSDPKFREIAGGIFSLLDNNEVPRVDRLMDLTQSPEVKSELSRIALMPVTFDPISRAVRECLATIKNKNKFKKIKELRKLYTQAHKDGDLQTSRHLLDELKQLKETVIPG